MEDEATLQRGRDSLYIFDGLGGGQLKLPGVTPPPSAMRAEGFPACIKRIRPFVLELLMRAHTSEFDKIAHVSHGFEHTGAGLENDEALVHPLLPKVGGWGVYATTCYHFVVLPVSPARA